MRPSGRRRLGSVGDWQEWVVGQFECSGGSVPGGNLHAASVCTHPASPKHSIQAFGDWKQSDIPGQEHPAAPFGGMHSGGKLSMSE
jgi:hypothetical protein